MIDKKRLDRFSAFARKANEAGLTVSPKLGAHQFMIQFPEGTLFLDPEMEAVEALIRFAADPESCFRADFFRVLLELRADTTDLAGGGRVRWQDVFASSSTTSFREWLVRRGFEQERFEPLFNDMSSRQWARQDAELQQKRVEDARKKRMTEAEYAEATRLALAVKPRDERAREGREALEHALVFDRYVQMDARAQAKYGSQMERDVREAIARVFSEEQFIRFHELYVCVLERERRRIDQAPEDELEAEAMSYGEEGPPSEYEIARKEAIAVFEKEYADPLQSYESIYCDLYDARTRRD